VKHESLSFDGLKIAYREAGDAAQPKAGPSAWLSSLFASTSQPDTALATAFT
jgi:hypothetical protein